jgi:16S rRNA (guanine966-N2)-methyltransferase
VRVIAGDLKGRRLKSPVWPGLRPTSDRLRETLFDILSDRVRGARVLDGYAGTGALGIEALSRGARAATFVESDRRAAALIAENAAHCGIADQCVIIRGSLDRALASLREGEPFDIVLLDPPYALGDEPDAILASVAGVIAPDGILVLEHSRRGAPPDTSGSLIRTRTVVAGDSALSWYRLRQPA